MTKPFRAVLARHRLVWVMCAGMLIGLAMEPITHAEGFTGPAASVEAKRLFTQGSALYLAGQFGRALEALESSHKLVPSPNSELVIARCLRELGRQVEAKEMFESAELEARRRADEGAPKYAQTAESAAAEGAAVRASLGTVRIRIEGIDSSTKVEVDTTPADVPPGGDVVVWHAPGEVVVSMRSSSGLEQRQVVTVRAGAEVTVGFGRPEPPPAEGGPLVGQPPPVAPHVATAGARTDRVRGPESSHAVWATSAAVVSGAVTLVATGLFAGFGLASTSEYNNLRLFCQSAGCGPADLPRASTGKRDQLIANVSLGIAAVAAAATATFAVIAITHPSRSKTNSLARWHLLVGPTTIGLTGELW